MKRFAMIGVILCLQSPAPAMQSPPPTIYYPLKDTFVKSDQPGVSYGSSIYLSAEEDPSIPVSERLYIKFNAPDLAGKTVVSASLRLWVIRENGGGGTADNFEILGVTSTWAETLTWTQAQTVTAGPVVATVPVKDYGISNDVAPSQPESFDITSLVQSWAAGGTDEGVMVRLAAGSKADLRFASMDSIERPELRVTYGSSTPPPPPPPPTPPPPPPAPRSGTVGGENNPCGCGTTSPLPGIGIVVALAAALMLLAARRP